MHIQETISATLAQVSRYVETLQNLLAEQQVADAGLIALAVQELCVNIVEHAYEGQGGVIEISGDLRPEWLTLTFRDHAPNRYTPPLVITAPDPLDLPEGGWGIYLIYQIIDRVEYLAHDDGNEWQLTKAIR